MKDTFQTLAGWDFERIVIKQTLLTLCGLPLHYATMGWCDIPEDARQKLLYSPLDEKPKAPALREWTVVIKVMADTAQAAVDAACDRLNAGGEPDAVLSCGVSFPDPDREGETVML